MGGVSIYIYMYTHYTYTYVYTICIYQPAKIDSYRVIEWADALVPPTPFQVRPLRRCKMRTENWDGLWKPVFCEERRCEGESVCLHLPRLQRECGQ